MTKRISSKYKINRRLGINLWGRPKSPVNKKNYGPGQHGQVRKKPSDFGLQLAAKQKLKGYYGNINERQFRKIYKEAERLRGDTSENLIGLLEQRLDAIVYRMKFMPTVFSSRQFINHGHILVNNKQVNIPSYRVSEGDSIEVKKNSLKNILFLDTLQSKERTIPDYLDVDEKTGKGKFIRIPKLNEVPYPIQMEPNLVIEYYSR